MDGFGWFAFSRVAALCTPKMAQVLGDKLDLAQLLRAFGAGERQPAALAA